MWTLSKQHWNHIELIIILVQHFILKRDDINQVGYLKIIVLQCLNSDQIMPQWTSHSSFQIHIQISRGIGETHEFIIANYFK